MQIPSFAAVYMISDPLLPGGITPGGAIVGTLCLAVLSLVWKVSRLSSLITRRPQMDPSGPPAKPDEPQGQEVSMAIRILEENAHSLTRAAQALEQKAIEHASSTRENNLRLSAEWISQINPLADGVRHALKDLERLDREISEFEGFIKEELENHSKKLASILIYHADDRRLIESLPELERTTKEEFDHIRQEFEDQFDRNLSWLASPYPRRFKVIEQSPSWEPILRGAALLGIRMREPLRLKVLCERCEGHISGDAPYRILGAKLEFEEEALKFYLDAGIAIGAIVLEQHLPALHFLVHDQQILEKLDRIAKEMPNGALKLGEHLAPGLLARILFNRSKIARKAPLADRDFRRAATDLFEKLKASPLHITNLGANAHIHIGMMIEGEDRANLETRRPYGGLVRVLSDSRKDYLWICDKCWAERYKIAERPSA